MGPMSSGMRSYEGVDNGTALYPTAPESRLFPDLRYCSHARVRLLLLRHSQGEREHGI
jgi:hypothetical protein